MGSHRKRPVAALVKCHSATIMLRMAVVFISRMEDHTASVLLRMAVVFISRPGEHMVAIKGSPIQLSGMRYLPPHHRARSQCRMEGQASAAMGIMGRRRDNLTAGFICLSGCHTAAAMRRSSLQRRPLLSLLVHCQSASIIQ